MKNRFTRNLKNKIIALIIGGIIFGGLQVLSITALKNVYLFGWLGQHLYCLVWAPAIWFVLVNKLVICYSIAFGCLLSTIVGQCLGDFLCEIRMAGITPESSAEAVAWASTHYGFFIWVITLAVCITVGAVIQFIGEKKAAKTEKT